jgi:hypothetical protein
MASGLFVDPTTLLRVAPLVSSSAAVWFCYDQWMYYGTFLHRDVKQKTNDILPAYWNAHISKGLAGIFSLYGLSAATGLANALSRGGRPAAPGSRWYLAGACLSVAHFVFVPWVAEEIRAMVHDGNAVESQARWMRFHLTRTFTVDIPGWVCFGLAVLHSVHAI